MNEAVWLPAFVVLGAGLILGLLLAFRLKPTRPQAKTTDAADLELKIRDLEARRDDLFRRIRAADEDQLSAEEKSALENAAALALRDLDALHGQMPQERARPANVGTTPPGNQETGDESATLPTPSRRSPLLTGLAFVAGMILVIGTLVYWAVRDAQPTPGMGGPTSTDSGSPMAPPHEGQTEIPPELAAQIASLQQQIVANPQDWLAKKQLALTYIAAGQFFEAFDQASQVLQQFPDDPDGLLVHGIVRLTMGQADQAVGLLDRVLAEHPDHRQALLYRGLALYQLGNVEQAMDTWDMGLQMVGGSDPEFEELLRMAQSGQGQPQGMRAAGPPGTAQSAGPPPAGTAEARADGFAIEIELAPEAQPLPQAVLFVFLRPEGGGPPVAATRVSSPTFPTGIVLDSSHSMMGAELPARGILVARLDSDGNVTTSDPTDLVIETPASMGQVTRVTLGQ
jgi:tetratricopeptide (TPR) repeat protein